MFKMNTVQKTKTGEKLMPFTVDGDIVSCFTKDKQVVYRKLSDFDFTAPPKDKEVIVVQPASEKSTDQLFTPEEDNSVDEDVVNEPEDSSNTEPEPTDTGSDTDPEEDGQGGSIWDTVGGDDDYI